MSDYDVLKQGMYVTMKATAKKEHEKAPDLMPMFKDEVSQNILINAELLDRIREDKGWVELSGYIDKENKGVIKLRFKPKYRKISSNDDMPNAQGVQGDDELEDTPF
tara:strand:- start:656 stop:976 length:321 start_codon:yes stop_codon:yes gene_type:complete